MNKKELVKIIVKQFDLSISKTNDIISTTLDTIAKSLSKGKALKAAVK